MSEAQQTGGRDKYALVAAVVAGLVGGSSWLKPQDNTATVMSYDATKAAILAVDERCQDDYDELDDRQAEFELWVTRRLNELDRDELPERKGESPMRGEAKPPPRKKRRPPPKPAAAQLPASDDLFE